MESDKPMIGCIWTCMTSGVDTPHHYYTTCIYLVNAGHCGVSVSSCKHLVIGERMKLLSVREVT